MLAGVSVDYYTKMERGNLSGVSESVLEALARGLQLDEAERAHLFDLARAAGPTVAPAPPSRHAARPAERAAHPRRDDPRAGARAERPPGHPRRQPARLRALLRDVPRARRPANHARFVFLDPRASGFFLDWERAADDTVAILRAEAGRDPHDRDLSDLVGELSTRSDDFRVRWAAHDVRAHQTGAKRFHHPIVGDLTLTFEMLELAADPGLHAPRLSAEPGTPSQDALSLLGSWAATAEPATTSPDGPPDASTTTTSGSLEDSAMQCYSERSRSAVGLARLSHRRGCLARPPADLHAPGALCTSERLDSTLSVWRQAPGFIQSDAASVHANK